MSHIPTDAMSKNRRGHRALVEIFLALRFGLVGSLATGIHIVTLWILLSKTLLPVLTANAIAFVSAFGFSFVGNYIWTFSASGSPLIAMRRFLIISISAFLINSIFLSAFLQLNWGSSIHAAITSAAAIPVMTFLACRIWGFKNNDSRQCL